MPARESVRLEPMTPACFEGWVEGSIRGYAQERAAAEARTPEEALERARAQFAELLPDGLATPGHELFTLVAGTEDVGMIWLAFRSHPDGEHVFGYDFEVAEAERRRGYGRAALEAVEAMCRSRGVVALELNVFGSNLGARALYEQMGFEPTAIQMRKRL